MFPRIVLSIVFVLTWVFPSSVFAGQRELSTYYPSPSGEYEQLQASTLSTGTVQPTTDGHLFLQPQAGDPAAWPAGNMGQFAYSSANDALYHYNGSIWVKDSPPVRPLPQTDQFETYQTGDDGYYKKGYSGARFTFNGDNTVTDNATGLTWIADLNALGAPFNAVMTWTNAITNCESLNYAGYGDWRLPNINELLSLANYHKLLWDSGANLTNKPIYDWEYFSPFLYCYWSSTTYTGAYSGLNWSTSPPTVYTDPAPNLRAWTTYDGNYGQRMVFLKTSKVAAARPVRGG